MMARLWWYLNPLSFHQLKNVLKVRLPLKKLSGCAYARMPPPGVGGGTLIFSYKRRLGSFFWVQNFEFQYFWGFRKMNIFWGMKILWIFLGVITKLDYI